ncbi:MAG: L-serine ammonia-lyase [Dysgonamonadaceae bacterium]|jgi:L-serine dehydratase|nr:L-serine ammonia-lyase [Dysgonamonadaceae bacterium]
MDSIQKIFKTGFGPSSSHTMGPANAADAFLADCPQAAAYKVILYGSLAATGKGHLSDKALRNRFEGKQLTIEWQPQVFLPEHPNGMEFFGYDTGGALLLSQKYFSIGGGDISKDGTHAADRDIYPLNKMKDIMGYLKTRRLWEYVDECEDKSIWDFLAQTWQTMLESIHNGLDHEGTLPGCLRLPRRASSVFSKLHGMNNRLKERYSAMAYAFAVSEENASGSKIVTAPTCGSCGILPAVLYSYALAYNATEKRILHALATAGLIGNVIKYNASLSGAEVGCQGEVGSACSMAAGALCQLLGGSANQIEYAAEMGLEHHLGLTCDPVCGLVQIPCIERNAFAALRAMDAGYYATFTDGTHIISLDKVIHVMKNTGLDLPSVYKETSLGGLAVENE